MNRTAVLFILAFFTLASCKKYEDKAGIADDRFNKHYCNDPEAVNYNWDFPGQPDSTLCFYPADVFIFDSTYRLVDTIYYSQELKFARVDTVFFRLQRLDRKRLRFFAVGSNKVWCTNQSLPLTADRYFKASVDSLLLPDSIKLSGYPYCPNDTVSGLISTFQGDKSRIRLDFTVLSDTGSRITFHKGTATLAK